MPIPCFRVENIFNKRAFFLLSDLWSESFRSIEFQRFGRVIFSQRTSTKMMTSLRVAILVASALITAESFSPIPNKHIIIQSISTLAFDTQLFGKSVSQPLYETEKIQFSVL